MGVYLPVRSGAAGAEGLRALGLRVLGLKPALAAEWLPSSDTRAAALVSLMTQLTPASGEARESSVHVGLAALTLADEVTLAVVAGAADELRRLQQEVASGRGHPIDDVALSRYLLAVALLRGVGTHRPTALVTWLKQQSSLVAEANLAGGLVSMAEPAMRAIQLRSAPGVSVQRVAEGIISPLCRLLLASVSVTAEQSGARCLPHLPHLLD